MPKQEYRETSVLPEHEESWLAEEERNPISNKRKVAPVIQEAEDIREAQQPERPPEYGTTALSRSRADCLSFPQLL